MHTIAWVCVCVKDCCRHKLQLPLYVYGGKTQMIVTKVRITVEYIGNQCTCKTVADLGVHR